MRKGTTPTIIIDFEDDMKVTDLTDAVFSVAQDGVEIIKKTFESMQAEASTNILEIPLTQQDTLLLDAKKPAELQLKVKIGDEVAATDIPRIPVGAILNTEEL